MFQSMFQKTRNQATDLVVQAQYLLDERRRKSVFEN